MKLEIPGRLPGLNEYIEAERTSRYKAAQMKRRAEQMVILCAKKQLRGVKFRRPVFMAYFWYEKDQRRDYDNICFAMKFIQDGLVKGGYLQNDGQKCFQKRHPFSHRFAVDKVHPRIEVEIHEIGEDTND